MNTATRTIVATLGIILGLSGMSHGVFEILQGNAPTSGLFIPAIGDAHKMWPYGNEYAFTLIPNFLITGIAAVLVSLAIVVWSGGFVQKQHGPAVFLLLFVGLLLVGGGVAQILFFPVIWLVSTRINKPLTGWRRLLPVKLQKPLGQWWPWCLAIGSMLLVSALGIGITGFVPAISNPEAVLSILLACLGLGAVILLLSFISGFAYDIARRPAISVEDR